MRLLFCYILCAWCMMVPRLIHGQPGEEFSGELPSWANVKKRFGAKGDGKNDDTKALQMALDSLSVPPKDYNMGKTGYATIYLSKGTYRITSTLLLKGKIGVNIIGEDPGTTSILWDGEHDKMMFWANGSAYFKVSRIAWNANFKKAITGIGVHWKTRWNDNSSQSFAPLNIEISDCYFTGKPLIGISGGTYGGADATGANDSEVTIQRCHFTECSKSGISITGFNALDYWIWDCRFIRCTVGVSNAHGNYHAYRCYFEGSRDSDFINDNGYYTSVRGCYSISSNYFSHDRGVSCNPFKRIFQANRVKPLKGNSVYFAHVGKPVFIDNIFSKGDNSSEYTLNYGSWCPGIYEVLSVGNRYAMSEPLKINMPRKKTFTVDDQLKYTGDLLTSPQSFLASQEPLPAKSVRKVFNVPRNASLKTIRDLILKAAALKGTRPIVHFGFGYYTIDEQLVIPAGSDMQIIGDGLLYASVLKRSRDFPKGKSMLKILGPTDVVIRDIQIADHDGSTNDVEVIEFVNADQPGSAAFLDQLHTSAKTSIKIDALDYLYVQKQNSFFSSGNSITGGKLVAEGRGTAGLYCFGGQFAELTVNGNARFVAKDCWWEGASRTPLNISGSGTITVDGVMIAPSPADSNTVIQINKFNGRISLMNAYVQGGISVLPQNPALNVLVWNVHFYHKMDPTDFINPKSSFKGAFLGLSTQCFATGNPSCGQILSKEDKVVRISDEKTFLLEMLRQDRTAAPRRYRGKLLNASTILMSRVSVGSSKTAVMFTK